MNSRHLVRVALGTGLLLVSLIAAGCGGVGPGGREVGGACQTDRDCTRTCFAGDSHYPGGICSARCTSDAQCPGGTACVDDLGGICAVLCSGANSCSGFGRGFQCDSENRRGAPGEVTVCRVP